MKSSCKRNEFSKRFEISSQFEFTSGLMQTCSKKLQPVHRKSCREGEKEKKRKAIAKRHALKHKRNKYKGYLDNQLQDSSMAPSKSHRSKVKRRGLKRKTIARRKAKEQTKNTSSSSRISPISFTVSASRSSSTT